jgi:hypothetical protein
MVPARALVWFDRVVRYAGTWHDPLFVAKDVCAALDITYHDAALAALEDHHKGPRVIVGTLGGPQEMATVTEAGLYVLILRSRKPAAKVFEKWLTTEVLPSIRRHGAYRPRKGEVALGLPLVGAPAALPLQPSPPIVSYIKQDLADLAVLLPALLGQHPHPRRLVRWSEVEAAIDRLGLFTHLRDHLNTVAPGHGPERLMAKRSRHIQRYWNQPIDTPTGQLVLLAHGTGRGRIYSVERMEGGAP